MKEAKEMNDNQISPMDALRQEIDNYKESTDKQLIVASGASGDDVAALKEGIGQVKVVDLEANVEKKSDNVSALLASALALTATGDMGGFGFPGMRFPRVKTSKNYNQSNLSATERLQHNLEIQTHNAKIDKKKAEKKERKKLAKLRQELRQEITLNN